MVLKAIQQFFDTRIQPAAREAPADSSASQHALQLATAALLIEMSRADFKVEENERRMVGEAVSRAFDLTPEETAELVCLADEEARQSISIYDFTRLIDRGFSFEQKKYIVVLLWRVALSDAELEKHEEHLIRQIAKLIHVPHPDFIDAKLRAQEALSRELAEDRPSSEG
jgi:uncharacterized tellurite resistance protein B-like protein